MEIFNNESESDSWSDSEDDFRSQTSSENIFSSPVPTNFVYHKDSSSLNPTANKSKPKRRRKPPHLLQKLFNRELHGKFSAHTRAPNLRLFDRVPKSCQLLLCDVLPVSALTNRHVFMGLSKCGQFLLTYTHTTDIDLYQFCNRHQYRLHWWLFVPHARARKVAEVMLFGNIDVHCELYISICQWPVDTSKLIVHGTCLHSNRCQPAHAHFTLTAVPSLNRCKDCLTVAASYEEDDLAAVWDSCARLSCLKHGLTIHTNFEVVCPYPKFDPNVSLKRDGALLFNSGSFLHVVRTVFEPANRRGPSTQREEPPSRLGDFLETCDGARLARPVAAFFEETEDDTLTAMSNSTSDKLWSNLRKGGAGDDWSSLSASSSPRLHSHHDKTETDEPPLRCLASASPPSYHGSQNDSMSSDSTVVAGSEASFASVETEVSPPPLVATPPVATPELTDREKIIKDFSDDVYLGLRRLKIKNLHSDTDLDAEYIRYTAKRRRTTNEEENSERRLSTNEENSERRHTTNEEANSERRLTTNEEISERRHTTNEEENLERRLTTDEEISERRRRTNEEENSDQLASGDDAITCCAKLGSLMTFSPTTRRAYDNAAKRLDNDRVRRSSGDSERRLDGEAVARPDSDPVRRLGSVMAILHKQDVFLQEANMDLEATQQRPLDQERSPALRSPARCFPERGCAKRRKAAAAPEAAVYEFTDDVPPSCEKLSSFRRRRLAEKKYEFSEEGADAENIVPYRRRSPTLSPPNRRPPDAPLGLDVGDQDKAVLRPLNRNIGLLSPRPEVKSAPKKVAAVEQPIAAQQPPLPANQQAMEEELPAAGKTDADKFSRKYLRRYIEVEDELVSIITDIEDDESGEAPSYILALPMEVHGAGYTQLQMVSTSKAEKLEARGVAVHQMSLDIEAFCHDIAARMCEEAGVKYSFCQDYDVEILDVCAHTGDVIVVAFMRILTSTETSIGRTLREQYQGECTFTWNMDSGAHSVLHSVPLKKSGPVNQGGPSWRQTAKPWGPAKEMVMQTNKKRVPFPALHPVRCIGNETTFTGQPYKSLADIDNLMEFHI